MILLKNMPQRTCLGCSIKKDKRDLHRIVINKENEVNVDLTGKMQGRGTYICNNIECLEKAIKTKKLDRALNKNFSEEIYNKLKEIISGGVVNG